MLHYKEHKPAKAKRIYKVENLNPQKGISASMKADEQKREYIVCLCLSNRVVQTSFPTEHGAIREIKRYRALYKAIELQK